jgi:hypothetical protein
MANRSPGTPASSLLASCIRNGIAWQLDHLGQLGPIELLYVAEVEER